MLKKTFFIITFAIMFFVFSTSFTFAANNWHTNCSITRLGVLSDGSTYVKLTDDTNANAFTNKAFVCSSSSMDKQTLATLLSAQAMGKNVSIYADSSSNPGLINIIVIINQ